MKGPPLWTYLDPVGLGLTLSLAALLLATALWITHRAMGHRLRGFDAATTGVASAAAGVGLNMLQAWLHPLVTLVAGVLLMLSGLCLLLGGVQALQGLKPARGFLVFCVCAGGALAWWFGVWRPDVQWRIGLLSALLCGLSVWLSLLAFREKRPAHRAGMCLLGVFGVVFAVLMALRTVAAVMGWLSSSVSFSVINAASVLAGGVALNGGVAGLVLLLSGEVLAMLHHQREHDALTGLLNRQGLRNWIDSLPKEQPLALAMVDLDHFKRINDAHGHAVGDQVIQALAAELRTLQGPGCRVARLGGEEFLVVQNATTSAALAARVEQLRSTFAGRQVVPRASFSAGVAHDCVRAYESALRRADALLYQAKSEGRNRVAC